MKFLEVLWAAGAEIYEVGGTVRDRLLGVAHKDKDFLVRHLPFTLLSELLKPYGRVALVGKTFGVLKFSPFASPEVTLDLALPRKELSTGIGHRDFEVSFDPSLAVEIDLGRRDFTINAMAYDLKKERLIDPLAGEQDLKARTLRQVFPNAFAEDPLRLIRAIQFAARFGLTIEPVTWEAMRANTEKIETVSPERITEELRKLFLAPIPSVGFNLMLEVGILKHLFPELVALRGIAQEKRPGDDVYQHTLRVVDASRADPYLEHPGDLELMLAALFHDMGKAATKRYDPKKGKTVFYGHQIVSSRMARKWLNKMRITTLGVRPENVIHLVANHMFETKSYFGDKPIRRFVRKIGQDLIFKLLDLRLADNRGGRHPRSIKGVLRMRDRIREELAKKPPFGPQDLAINGNDLKDLGFAEGPNIGKVLKRLVEMALEDPNLNTRESLLAIVGQMVENEPGLLSYATKSKNS